MKHIRCKETLIPVIDIANGDENRGWLLAVEQGPIVVKVRRGLRLHKNERYQDMLNNLKKHMAHDIARFLLDKGFADFRLPEFGDEYELSLMVYAGEDARRRAANRNKFLH